MSAFHEEAVQLNPFVRCVCGKAHIAIDFSFKCECGRVVNLTDAKVKVV
jgi:hypothetical protein